jgi:hypothetical protein
VLLKAFSPDFILAIPLVFHFLEEVDRLFRGSQKYAPFHLGKGSCLQRENEKGNGDGSRRGREIEDLDQPFLHPERDQGDHLLAATNLYN